MEKEYPKRLFRDGNELQMKKLNNSCRISILTKIKNALPNEYEQVKNDPVFVHVFAIYENGLGYSARLIHNMMCRQLVTKKKRELWFVFGGKPLRFSMQEFHAVTGLKCNDDFSCDLEKWKDDKGFWSRLIKRNDKICIKRLMDVHLSEVHTWSDDDRIRFVYVCVIAGLIKAKDEKKPIPIKYIQLVMDLDKVRTYPWGVKAFKSLVKSIIKKREDLKKINSYALDGFSYALQIWVMEAIPDIGELLGEKINKDFVEGPRCSNWKGAAKVSYDEIIQLESTFGPNDVVYPYISLTGNFDVFESVQFLWYDEMSDSAVDNLNALIRSGNDFGDHIWGSVEDDDADSVDDDVEGDSENEATQLSDEENQVSGLEGSKNTQVEHGEVNGLKRCRKKKPDHGAKKRNKKLLYQRATTTHGAFDALEDSFSSFEKKIIKALEDSFSSFEKKIVPRLEKIEEYVSLLKDQISSSEITEKTKATVSQQPVPIEKKSKFVVRIK